MLSSGSTCANPAARITLEVETHTKSNTADGTRKVIQLAVNPSMGKTCKSFTISSSTRRDCVFRIHADHAVRAPLDGISQTELLCWVRIPCVTWTSRLLVL